METDKRASDRELSEAAMTWGKRYFTPFALSGNAIAYMPSLCQSHTQYLLLMDTSGSSRHPITPFEIKRKSVTLFKGKLLRTISLKEIAPNPHPVTRIV